MAEKRRSRADLEQQHFEGMAPERIPEVHKAGVKFLDMMDEAKLATKRKKEAGLALIAAMKKHNVPHYRYDKIDLKIGAKDEVKAKVIVAERVAKPKKPKKEKANNDDAAAE